MKLFFWSSSRRTLIWLSAFVVITFLANYYYFSSSLPRFTAVSSPLNPGSWFTAPPSKFWHEFASVLKSAAPKCKKPQLSTKAKATARVEGENWKERKVKNYIDMSGEDLDDLADSHALMVASIDQEKISLDYEPGTTGIVTSAGGKYFPVLLTSLLMLRRTGSQLPVEVFLATAEEYEPLICDTVFPSLNAKCIILTDLLKSSKISFQFEHFQLKIFAILFSSFENVLFLDADSFPVRQPEELFASEPFTSHHLVLWPDYWIPTFSPYFSQISGVSESLLMSRPTIEAGQILVDKARHWKTLMLAAYYNAYGEYYYDLITQGGPGEGDKDTFAPAAIAFGLPFYTVEQPPTPLGTPGDGAAVLQSDPMADYGCKVNGTACEDRKPFFIHASWQPKLNALTNVRSVRQWGSEEESRRLFDGEDMEPIAWGYMVDMACNDVLEFRDWGDGNKSSTGVCEQVKRCFRDMFGSEYQSVES